MSRKLAAVLFSTLVLVGAMGLKTVVVRGSDSVLMANGSSPLPKPNPPFRNGSSPLPKPNPPF